MTQQMESGSGEAPEKAQLNEQATQNLEPHEDPLMRQKMPTIQLAPDWSVKPGATGHTEPDAPDWSQERIGSRFVMTEGNPFRIWWQGLVMALLCYIATFFLYRICFQEFKIPDPEPSGSAAWDTVDEFVNAVFVADLVIGFFLSYRDRQFREVRSLPRVTVNYLRTYFIINLIACIPPDLVEWMLSVSSDQSDGKLRIHETARVVRLRSLTRLARLARLVRLVKLMNMSNITASELWRKLEGVRSLRVLSLLTVGLGMACHILACGWYLIAALHKDPYDTWVARRKMGNTFEEEALISRSSAEHYLHSMYFVLTVFTTAGFGDMYAQTGAEVIYVIFVMLVGTVIHSIIIGEVINLVTATDRKITFVYEQKGLIEAYASSTEMNERMARRMMDFVSINASNWMMNSYNRDGMRSMILGRYLPRDMLNEVPYTLYNGNLMLNQFLQPKMMHLSVPPRLPLLLALHLQKGEFSEKEVVYQKDDTAFNLFLVLKGTFAFIARPTPYGGIDDHYMQKHKGLDVATTPSHSIFGLDASDGTLESNMFPYRLFGKGSYFGEAEILDHHARICTAICESQAGAALVLHKTDFEELCDSFPQFARAWNSEANRREAFRRQKLDGLKRPALWRPLAAAQIQAWWRSGIMRWRKGNQKQPEKRGSEGGRRNSFLMGVQESGLGTSVTSPRRLPLSRGGTDVTELHSKIDALARGMEVLSKEVRQMRTEMVVQASRGSCQRGAGDVEARRVGI